MTAFWLMVAMSLGANSAFAQTPMERAKMARMQAERAIGLPTTEQNRTLKNIERDYWVTKNCPEVPPNLKTYLGVDLAEVPWQSPQQISDVLFSAERTRNILLGAANSAYAKGKEVARLLEQLDAKVSGDLQTIQAHARRLRGIREERQEHAEAAAYYEQSAQCLGQLETDICKQFPEMQAISALCQGKANGAGSVSPELFK